MRKKERNSICAPSPASPRTPPPPASGGPPTSSFANVGDGDLGAAFGQFLCNRSGGDHGGGGPTRSLGARPRAAATRAPPRGPLGARAPASNRPAGRPPRQAPQRPSGEQVRAARAATRRRGLTHRVGRGRLGLPEAGQAQPHGRGGAGPSWPVSARCAARRGDTRVPPAGPPPPGCPRLGSAPRGNSPAARDSAPAPRLASAPRRRLPAPPRGPRPARARGRTGPGRRAPANAGARSVLARDGERGSAAPCACPCVDRGPDTDSLSTSSVRSELK